MFYDIINLTFLYSLVDSSQIPYTVINPNALRLVPKHCRMWLIPKVLLYDSSKIFVRTTWLINPKCFSAINPIIIYNVLIPKCFIMWLIPNVFYSRINPRMFYSVINPPNAL